jgi:hypothetical protein
VVGERYNRAGRRLLLQVDPDTICSVPPRWTDQVAPDPQNLVGDGRSYFRTSDLLELAEIVEALGAAAAEATHV